MNKIETEDIKELFAEWGLWSLIDDVSPDGDGHGDNLQLTKEGLEAERMINQLLEEKEIEQSNKISIKKEEWKERKKEIIRNYNPEKGWGKYKKSKIKVKGYNLIPKVELEEKEETFISKKISNEEVYRLYVLIYDYNQICQGIYKELENKLHWELVSRGIVII